MEVLVILPAFNEASAIGGVLRSLPDEIDGHDVIPVVVDDGSTDGTADVARSAGADVICQESNRGKGAALCAAMDLLHDREFGAMVWMDSDGQHLPSSLTDVVGPVLAGDVDLCVGSRYLAASDGEHAPWNRRMVRAGTIAAVERITGERITDPFSGFRAFSQRAAEAVELVGCGYEAELESHFAVLGAGMRFREVPIPRLYGANTSKMGARHGRAIGRLLVVTGYARTLHRAWRQGDRAGGASVNA